MPGKTIDGGDGELVIETTSGSLRGTRAGDTVRFLGIPYAQAPLGSRRWRAPEAVEAWRGVRDARAFGKRCIQFVAGANHDNESEDCLFLNVFLPARARREALPVMVWIHGGSNSGGSADFYDAAPLVTTDDGVIVVTLNYRLGTLGFLAHPDLAGGGTGSTNFGILDQQQALRWVRTNIGQFGGDADNITIFGESAGGLDVLLHMASPLSADLFDKAIVQSGGYYLDTPNLDQSRRLGIDFAERVACPSPAARCLRELTVAALIEDLESASQLPYNQATIDGLVLQDSLRELLRTGRLNDAPVITGANSEEGRSTTPREGSIEDYRQLVAEAAEAAALDRESVQSAYRKSWEISPFLAAAHIDGDRRFACTNQDIARYLAPRPRVFAFEFGDEGAGDFGAAHAMELKYLFAVDFSSIETPEVQDLVQSVTGNPGSLPETSRKVSLSMRRRWVEFARTGNPNIDGLPNWPEAAEGMFVFASNGPDTISHARFAALHVCNLWRDGHDGIKRETQREGN